MLIGARETRATVVYPTTAGRWPVARKLMTADVLQSTPTPDAHPSLSIVIGLKDEEDNVEPLIEEIHEVGLYKIFDLEVILIDDGSTDRTLEMIRREMERHPYIVCHR